MHKSYLIKIAAVGTAGVLALAACSSSSKSSSSGGGLGGGGSSSAAGGGGNYKIGFQGPLSGDNAQLGINEVQRGRPCREPGQPEQHLRLQGDAGEVRRRRRPVRRRPGRGAQVLQQDPAILGVDRSRVLRRDQGRRGDLRRRPPGADLRIGDQPDALAAWASRPSTASCPPTTLEGRRPPTGWPRGSRRSSSSMTCPTTARVSPTRSSAS